MSLVDKRSIFLTIGCLLKNPSLLNNTTRYNLNKEDFPEKFHKIIFAAIYNLWNEGITNIDYIMIDNYLSKYDLQYQIFVENNGIEYLQEAKEVAELSSFNYGYDRIKKFSLLRAYQEKGIDVSYLYDEKNVNLRLQEEMQERFDKFSLEQLTEEVDKRIVDIKGKFLLHHGTIGQHASEGIKELKEELKESPEIGLPLRGGIMNMITRGARLRKLYMRSAPTSVGKAIPNNAFIPTPMGIKKVGDISEGDFVFGEDGKPTKVLQVYPQGEKEIWEVLFSDGRKAECCEDHLWRYKYKSHRTHEYRIETAKEIYTRAQTLKNGFKNSWDKGYRFHINLNKPVEYSKKEYGIDPYIMGLILGDGSFRYNNTNKGFAFSSDDIELVEAISNSLNMKYKKCSEYNYSYMFKLNETSNSNLWVEHILKDYPKLWNVKSEGKFIPEEYLYGSVEQRYSLLQGLLDTDGSIDKRTGTISFHTVSVFLKEQMMSLCYSLGMTATCSIDKREDKYTFNKCYIIRIQCKKDDKLKVFRLKRKLRIVGNYVNNNKRAEHKTHLGIVDIKPTTKKTKMTCFTVDNENHLFLMNDYIVTHNTRLALGDACNLGTNEIYSSELNRWVKNGIATPTLFITSELEMDEIQTPLLAFLSDVNETKILDGEYTADEEARVEYAIKVLQKGQLWIEYLPNFSYHDIENTVKRYFLNKKVRYYFFDYLHTTMKMLSEIGKEAGGIRLREDNILHMFSTNLKELCNELGVFMYTATQVSGDWEGKKTANQNIIRGAKAIADKLDVGMIALEPTKEDLDALKPILEKGFELVEQPNLVFHVYKLRRSPYQNIKVWSYVDLGTCRLKNLFVTKNDYTLIPVQSLSIEVTEE